MSRMCFAVFAEQRNENGFIPSVVTEGESGHRPMVGSGDFSEPWYWGKDWETAERVCRKENERLGLTPADVDEIMGSSITASIREDAARERAQAKITGRDRKPSDFLDALGLRD